MTMMRHMSAIKRAVENNAWHSLINLMEREASDQINDQHSGAREMTSAKAQQRLIYIFRVTDLKKKFGITSSVVAVTLERQENSNTSVPAAMENDWHELLISTVFVIYNTYLAPSSQLELKFDNRLWNELYKYLMDNFTNLTSRTFQIGVELEQFIKTPKVLAKHKWFEDFDHSEVDWHTSPPGVSASNEVRGLYFTVYQQIIEVIIHYNIKGLASFLSSTNIGTVCPLETPTLPMFFINATTTHHTNCNTASQPQNENT
ncbi:hypothetical protein BDQ17DRAFT_1327448 [Cyathus striatus]|nr:hypothetical protein BDQ17DRAFT_1327448 [Cyathus striatus]